MSDCPDFQLHLDYVGRRLDEPGVVHFERHLSACVACRDMVAELVAPVAPALRQRAQQALAKRAASPRRGRIAAMAAAALFLLAYLPQFSSGPTVPEYEVAGPSGGVQQFRGSHSSSDESRRFIPESRVSVLLKPVQETRVDTPELATFVLDGGRLSPVPAASMVRSEQGSFRFEARAGDLFGSLGGTRELVFVLAPRNSGVELLRGLDAAGAQREHDEYRWINIRLNYVVGGSP